MVKKQTMNLNKMYFPLKNDIISKGFRKYILICLVLWLYISLTKYGGDSASDTLIVALVG